MMKPFEFPFTAFHNYVLDHVMPHLSGSGWKVLCVAIRQTLGWQDESTESGRKESDRISYSQFQAKTGIKSATTVAKAIQENLEKGYLLRDPSSDHPQGYDYRLNQDYETTPENGVVGAGTTPENGVVSPKTTPENGHTKESLKERDSKENISASADFLPPEDDYNFLAPIGRGEYKPGPGKLVSCVDPDTDEVVGEPDWRFPRGQVQNQAFEATGRKRFRTRAEWNKLRKIERMLDNGELPYKFWNNRLKSARKYRWSFPKLLRYTLSEDSLRDWEGRQGSNDV